MCRVFLMVSVLSLTKLAAGTYPQIGFDLHDALKLKPICSATKKAHLSSECREQLEESCSNRSVLTLMIDAASKFPYSGLNVANGMDLGNFDECIRLKHLYPNGSISGKYCTNGLVLHDLVDASNKRVSYKLATCIPNGCSAGDYNNIFEVIYSNKFTGIFNDDFCTTNETKKLTTTALVIISIFAIVITLMVVSTVYDFHLKFNRNRYDEQSPIPFSLLCNGRNLLETDVKDEDHIYVFDGIRFITALWIVLSHTDILWNFAPVMNVKDLEHLYNQWYSFYSHGATAGVDTFFFMSGFVVAYNYLKNKQRTITDHLCSIPRFYIHRFLRIAPAVYMIYFVMMYLLEYIANGPLSAMGCHSIKDRCQRRWAFFLFLENYYNGKYCIFQIWYLSVDMQLYVLSPLVLIPLAIKLKNGEGLKSCMLFLMGLNIIVFCVSLATALVFKKHDNYCDSHHRAVAYITGLMMATYIRERPNQTFLGTSLGTNAKMVINLIVWLIALSVLCLSSALHNYLNDINKDPSISSLYVVLAKPFWVLSLCWIVYSCRHGYGGIANWILTRPIMIVGGKLSYSIYVVQCLPIYLHYNTLRNKIYVSEWTLNCNFWAVIIATVALAYFWRLAFEAPIVTLEKIIFVDAHVKTVKEPAETDDVSNENQEFKSEL